MPCNLYNGSQYLAFSQTSTLGARGTGSGVTEGPAMWGGPHQKTAISPRCGATRGNYLYTKAPTQSLQGGPGFFSDATGHYHQLLRVVSNSPSACAKMNVVVGASATALASSAHSCVPVNVISN